MTDEQNLTNFGDDQVPVDDAATKETKRAEIESLYNGEREKIEANYANALSNLEADYRQQLASNTEAKQKELNGAGLNLDGSDPQGRQQGLVPEDAPDALTGEPAEDLGDVSGADVVAPAPAPAPAEPQQ